MIIFDSDKLLFYTPTNRFIRSVDLVPQLHRDTDIIRSINSIDFAEPGKLLFKYDLMYRCNVFYSTYNYNTDELKDIGYVPLSLDLGNTLNRVNLDFFETAPYKQELSCAILYNDTIFQYRQDSLSPRFIINALKDKVIPGPDSPATERFGSHESRQSFGQLRYLYQKYIRIGFLFFHFIQWLRTSGTDLE